MKNSRPILAARSGLMQLLPAAVNWTLIAYALVLLAGIWAFAVERIESDYRSTLETEREHLRSVSATLEAQVEAMLGDGVGAALAAANELDNRSDLIIAGDTQLADSRTCSPAVRTFDHCFWPMPGGFYGSGAPAHPIFERRLPPE
jgi:hypothetical protein